MNELKQIYGALDGYATILKEMEEVDDSPIRIKEKFNYKIIPIEPSFYDRVRQLYQEDQDDANIIPDYTKLVLLVDLNFPLLPKEHQCYIAVENDNQTLLGFIHSRWVAETKRFQLNHLVVHKSHRRQGIGSALIQRCIEEAKKCNVVVKIGHNAALLKFFCSALKPIPNQRPFKLFNFSNYPVKLVNVNSITHCIETLCL